MTRKHCSFFHTTITAILLCGVFTAAGGTAFSDRHDTRQTDAGVGADAGWITNEITVVIDAGHGGEDGGTQSAAGLLEKEINLEIAKLLEAMLRANGIATVMTRNEDILLYDRNADYQGHKKMLDLAARRRTAEETEHAVFVSIHMNYFPEPQYRGMQVFYSAHHPNSEILAEQIQCTASTYWQSNNKRQTKPATSAIYLLDRLTCPAVLVECGFLSNPEEAALFSQADYKQEAAFTIFSALMSYISESNA